MQEQIKNFQGGGGGQRAPRARAFYGFSVRPALPEIFENLSL